MDTTLGLTIDRVDAPDGQKITLRIRPRKRIDGAGIVRGVALGLLMWLAAGVAWMALRWMGLV